jgi:hypothetical protein
MRQLSNSFIESLIYGFLAPLREKVIADVDLNLEIRENHINIYFKGNSLLRLNETKPYHYRAFVHPKFLEGFTVPHIMVDEGSAAVFLTEIPRIKENILRFGCSSIEIEYEQMIIRANNDEPRNSSEYFIVDRQYSAGEAGRFDLTGLYWPRVPRRRGDTVFPCLIEVKYALNSDIKEVHRQLSRYYQAVAAEPAKIAVEMEQIFKQKLALGIYDHQPKERREAMETLTFCQDLNQFQFIVILVDYNPHSNLLNLDALRQLSFANQIRVWQTGFAMWERNIEALSAELLP